MFLRRSMAGRIPRPIRRTRWPATATVTTSNAIPAPAAKPSLATVPVVLGRRGDRISHRPVHPGPPGWPGSRSAPAAWRVGLPRSRPTLLRPGHPTLGHTGGTRPGGPGSSASFHAPVRGGGVGTRSPSGSSGRLARSGTRTPDKEPWVLRAGRGGSLGPSPGVSLRQELPNQPVEPLSPLDLGPVPTLSEQVQLCSRNQLEEPVRGRQRDRLVLSTLAR
jgi:hypothetical protein